MTLSADDLDESNARQIEKRFALCDAQCTADCGHCKGGLVEGSPASKGRADV